MKDNFIPLSSVAREGFGTPNLIGTIFPLQLKSISTTLRLLSRERKTKMEKLETIGGTKRS